LTTPGAAVYDELQRANRRASRVLLTGSVFLVAALVWIAAGWFAAGAALDPAVAIPIVLLGTLIGVGATYTAYRSGPTLALRAAKARPVSRAEAPELHNLLDEVCVSAGISGTKPKLHVVVDPAPNAFATGLSLEDSHVAVTTGLIERLPRYELRAVLAHEVAHIINDDIRAVTVAVATAGVVALLADVLARSLWFGGGRGGGGRGGGGRRGGGGNAGAAQLIFLVLGLVAIVLAPIAAQLIRFAVSRQREFLADATAAEVLRDPQSMVNALRRIDGDRTELARFEAATAHLWFEEPNETRGQDRTAKLARRFATHPSMEDRIERLATLNAGTVRTDAPLAPVDRPPGDTPPPDRRSSSPPPPPPPGAPGSGPGQPPSR
jgi:heat shock protein HtpX